ncbi:MAG TPA: HAD hydrolase-like protein [Patescibacteria group bacterium]|nr:HAD hydrolase-like protein [Patescibacteria group bacterium]
MATFIFDFDGTLADSFPLVADVTYGITGAPRLSTEQIKSLERLPMLKAVHGLGVPNWKLPQVMLLTRRRMTPRMAQEVQPYPGMVEVVRQLHEAGHGLFVLTSNYVRNVHAFLEAQQLADCFENVYHCSVFYKSIGMRRVVRKNHLDKATCYYVGNEPGDIKGAERTGIHGIAVTWSGQDENALRAARPLKIINTPQELLGVFN